MPTRWAPWPVKTAAGGVSPVAAAVAGGVAASWRRPVSSWVRSPTSTARWLNRDRLVTSDRAMPTRPVSGCVVRKSCSAAACPDRAWPDLADSTSGTTPAGASATGPHSPGSVANSSSTTCAFVPLMPNEETPARRGPAPRLHSRSRVSSSTPWPSHATSRVGFSAWRLGGIAPWRIACTILMMPPTPAAAWAWPMLDFNDPRYSGVPVVCARP